MKKLLSLLALVLMSCMGAWAQAQSYIYKISLLSLDDVTENTDVPVVIFAGGDQGYQSFIKDNTSNYTHNNGTYEAEIKNGTTDRAAWVFTLRKAEDGTITLKDSHGKYWSKTAGNVSGTDNVEDAAKFTLTLQDGNTKKYRLSYIDGEDSYNIIRNAGSIALNLNGTNWVDAQFYTFLSTDFAMPFKASESVETATWYSVSQVSNTRCFWQIANGTTEGSNLGRSTAAIYPNNANEYAFCFIPTANSNEFKIYNKATSFGPKVTTVTDHAAVKVGAEPTTVSLSKNGSDYYIYDTNAGIHNTLCSYSMNDNYISISNAGKRENYSGAVPTLNEYKNYTIVIEGVAEGRLVINGQEYADGSIFVPTISNIATYGSAKQLTGYKGEVTLNGTTITVNYAAGRNVTYDITATNSEGNEISWSETKFVPAGTAEASVEDLSYDYFSDFTITEDDKHLGNEDVTFHVTATHTLPMVPGKFYHIRYVNGSNQWYMNYEDDTHVQLKAAKNGSSANNLWYVEQASANAPYFSLCSVANLKAVHGTTDGNRVCVEFVDNFAYEFVPSNSNFRIFEAGTNKNLGAHAYYNGSANSGLGMWNTGNHTGGTEYTVEEFDESILNFTNGEEGYVGYCENFSDFTSAKTTFTSAKSAANLKAALDAMADLDRIEIAEGKYYQITFNRGNQALGNYGAYANTEGTVSTDAASRTVTTADYTTANTLAGLWQFENDANGVQLKSVQTGFYLGNVDGGHLVTTAEKNWGKVFTLKNGNNSATTWQMSENGKSGSNTLNIYYNPGSNTSREIGYYSANDAGDYFTIKEVTSIPVAISSVGYSTVNFPVAVTIPEDVKAYKVTEETTTSMKLEEVTGDVAAGTALIVEKENGGNVTFAIVESGETISGNLLKGTTARRTGFGENSFYALAAEGAGVAFKQNGSVTAIPANKAYLPVTTGGSNKALYFDFGGITTSIDAAEVLPATDALYNINGQRVVAPTRGIYVKANGQKVFIK